LRSLLPSPPDFSDRAGACITDRVAPERSSGSWGSCCESPAVAVAVNVAVAVAAAAAAAGRRVPPPVPPLPPGTRKVRYPAPSAGGAAPVRDRAEGGRPTAAGAYSCTWRYWGIGTRRGVGPESVKKDIRTSRNQKNLKKKLTLVSSRSAAPRSLSEDSRLIKSTPVSSVIARAPRADIGRARVIASRTCRGSVTAASD
jgi:hypothetical protein